MWCLSLFYFIFVRYAPPINVQQEIASAFVDRFRCGLQRFFRTKSPFLPIEQFSKLSLDGGTIGARMAEKMKI